MDGTPRLRSAFPNTPRTSRRTPTQNSTPNGSNAFRPSPKLPDVDTLKSSQPDTAPLIPTEFLQPPSQRAAAFAVYGLVLFYHLYDAYCLSLDETESLWLFMKWVLVDAIFLFGLPSLRIPWLEWSSSTMMVLFLAHALLDGILMFRIPVCCKPLWFEEQPLTYTRFLATASWRSPKSSSIKSLPCLNVESKRLISSTILPSFSAVKSFMFYLKGKRFIARSRLSM